MVELYDVQIISQLGCFKKKIKKGHPGQEKKKVVISIVSP